MNDLERLKLSRRAFKGKPAKARQELGELIEVKKFTGATMKLDLVIGVFT